MPARNGKVQAARRSGAPSHERDAVRARRRGRASSSSARAPAAARWPTSSASRACAGRAGGGPAPDRRRLRQRRVAGLQPDGVAGRPHDLRLLAGGAGLPRTCPAWTVKAVGGTSTHWAGACPRFKDHEFRAQATYGGGIDGANLLDWPIALADLEPVLRPGRDQDGRDPRPRPPAAAGEQQLQGVRQRRRARRLHGVRDGTVRARTPSRTTAGPASDPGRLQLPGRQAAASKWSTLVAELPKAARDRQPRPAARMPRRADHPRRRGRADARAVRRRRRGACSASAPRSSASPATRSRRRACCCCRPSPLHPGRPGELAPGRSGATTCATSPGRSTAASSKPVHMYRGETMAGVIADEARPTTRTAGSPAATTWRRCRSARRSWPRSSSPGLWGPDFTEIMDAYAQHGRHVARR